MMLKHKSIYKFGFKNIQKYTWLLPLFLLRSKNLCQRQIREQSCTPSNNHLVVKTGV